MFIIELIKAMTGKQEKVKRIPVKTVEVDINKLPQESQDWIRRLYNKKNNIKESAV